MLLGNLISFHFSRYVKVNNIVIVPLRKVFTKIDTTEQAKYQNRSGTKVLTAFSSEAGGRGFDQGLVMQMTFKNGTNSCLAIYLSNEKLVFEHVGPVSR